MRFQIEDLRFQIAERIRERGPLTVAAFMDLALYHPEFGYYARAAQRSGRAGDFFTSVDVGPLFGELLEVQIAEMAATLSASSAPTASSRSRPCFDLVEAGAGNARLSADILRAMRDRDPDLYRRTRLHLVEASRAARDAQRETLHDVADRLVSSSATLPDSFDGVLLANELLDAFPVHQVVMRHDGLREMYVRSTAEAESLRSRPRVGEAAAASDSPELLRGADAPSNRGGGGVPAARDEGGAPRQVKDDGRLSLAEGPPSTPALAEYLQRIGVVLEPGWRVEINLRAVDWIRAAATRLERGFLILIDYGHEARELYSVTHAAGTLTTFARHTMEGAESTTASPAWLRNPGEQDMTSHVDFTSIRAAAEAQGLTTIGFLDQTYFLLGLVADVGTDLATRDFKRRLALKTLLMPGGLGSTMKVLILGKGVGTPELRGCSYRMRVT